MSVLEIVIIAFWVMLPAYVPNNVAVLAGGGRPIDGGRTFGDARLLGDGKTWRGTIAGITAGLALALALNVVVDPLSGLLNADLPSFEVIVGLTLAAGAMLGDILASFLKRRTGRKRGAPFPLVDQLDFAVVALALTALVAPGWFFDVFTLPVIAAVLIITPILHVVTNVFAYLFGLKPEPW